MRSFGITPKHVLRLLFGKFTMEELESMKKEEESVDYTKKDEAFGKKYRDEFFKQGNAFEGETWDGR